MKKPNDDCIILEKSFSARCVCTPGLSVFFRTAFRLPLELSRFRFLGVIGPIGGRSRTCPEGNIFGCQRNSSAGTERVADSPNRNINQLIVMQGMDKLKATYIVLALWDQIGS
jgi:hypothetical protein